MKDPLSFLAKKIYSQLAPVLFKNRNQKVLGALKQLYPRKNAEKLYEEYQIRKLTLMLIVLIVGTVSAVLLHLSSRMEGKLMEGARLIRNEWDAGDYQVTLLADAGSWREEIPFLVKERQLSEEEIDQLIATLYAELPDLIRKDNQDLQQITGDLNLMSFVEGYPFRLSWSSDSSGRVSRDGKVNRTDIAENGEEITISVRVSYEEKSTDLSYKVFLLPETFSEQENFFKKLNDSLSRMDSAGVSKKQLQLPSNLDGKNISWAEKKTDGGILLIFLALAGCVVISQGMEKDLAGSCRKREKQLLMDYPGFVSKLRLYLSAGLTVKSAFLRITSDYGSQNLHGKTHYLYEEMKISCYQLENGMMEEQVYQDFSRRCGKIQYRRLGFLLSVHLKQGNGQLLTLLSQEADSAREDGRNMAKKAGEEAGIRLLFPMMLMLVVIMFLILLPAYIDFGSI